MIGSTTYFTAECDGCKTAFGKAHPTEKQEHEALTVASWAIFGNRCFCQKCVDIYNRVCLARAETEARATPASIVEDNYR